MWSKREAGMFMQHHAVLIVGSETNPQLFHWSYHRRTFAPGVINERLEGRGPSITCVPKRDFAINLPMLIPQSLESDYVRFSAQEAFRIPKSWQAEWRGGASRILRLATTAPDFPPLTRRWRDLAPIERDSNEIFIEWNPEWVLSLMKAAPGGTVVEQGTEFGLAKTKTVFHGGDSKDYVGYQYFAYADEEPNGNNTTIIGCGTPTEAYPKSCQHRFLNKGRHYYFRHRPEDVADWRGMQQRILHLMASFEIQDDSTGRRQ
jgi:hypothetical protein